MDSRWTQPSIDSQRQVQTLLFAASDAYADIADGTAVEVVDLSQYVTRMRQTESELAVVLQWHTELNGSNMPRAGQHLAVYLNTQLLCIRTIDAINDYDREYGQQSLSLTARSRDAFPAWRRVVRTTRSYPMGTPLDEIVSDVATAVGIADSENLIGSLAMSTPQSNAQLSQVSAWEMLEQLLLVAGLYPFTDAIGRLKAYSRDLFRASDVVLDDDRVKRVRGSKSRAPLSRLLLKWRSPTMTIVKQQDRSLASATLTAGFFQLQQRKEVWWSDDRTQRAMDTRLVIKQSANSGLIPVCSENYDANNDGEDATGGVVELDTLFYVPTLLSFYVAGKIALALVPEPVVTTGVVGQVGATEPEYGRYAEAVADVFILTLLASLGTGVYEVWGTPYDFVNPINQTEAYDPDAETQLENVETIETDFAGDEGHAQVIVRREFVFRVRAATSFGLSIVDDPRIEEGDIVELADGSRVFVTSFSRDLSPGAPAVLEIGGFPA